MFLSEGALVLSEIDNGPTVEALTGGGDMEYFLSIQGEERLIHVLELLGGEVGRPLVVLLDEAGLAQLADALRERFGNDLNLPRAFVNGSASTRSGTRRSSGSRGKPRRHIRRTAERSTR